MWSRCLERALCSTPCTLRGLRPRLHQRHGLQLVTPPTWTTALEYGCHGAAQLRRRRAKEGAELGLFFSGYAEGSSNNKFMEIYNPTGTLYLTATPSPT